MLKFKNVRFYQKKIRFIVKNIFFEKKLRIFNYSFINYSIKIELLCSKIFLSNIFRQTFCNNSFLKSQNNFRNVNIVNNALKNKLFILTIFDILKSSTLTNFDISKLSILTIFNILNKIFMNETIYFTSFKFTLITRNINFVI